MRDLDTERSCRLEIDGQTPPTPGACSPDRAFTNCQALIKSSNSNPAPLIDRNVPGAGLALLSREAFGFDVFLDWAIDFRMRVAPDYYDIRRREAARAVSSQPYGGLDSPIVSSAPQNYTDKLCRQAGVEADAPAVKIWGARLEQACGTTPMGRNPTSDRGSLLCGTDLADLGWMTATGQCC